MWPPVSFRDHASEAAPGTESRSTPARRRGPIAVSSPSPPPPAWPWSVAGVALALGERRRRRPWKTRSRRARGRGLHALPQSTRSEGVHSITTPDGSSDEWNTDPPTTGPHYEVPVIWGSYDEPVNQAQLVHNLEHGGVAIQYGDDVPAATVEELEGFVQENPTGHGPRAVPELGNKIALGAWVTESASEPREGHRVPREVHRVRRGRVQGVPRRVPVPGPGAVPGRLDAARQHLGLPAADTLGAPPGWRNWSDAAGLKPAVPLGHRGSTPSPGT